MVADRLLSCHAGCLSPTTHSLSTLHALPHIPPRRACPSINDKYSKVTCGTSACAEVISSIDDLTLSLLKTGFTV